MDKKVIGYAVAVVGLIVLVLGAGSFDIPLIGSLNNMVLNIVGMVFVGLGVVLVVMGGGRSGKYKGKRHSKNGGKVQDLPVYEGDNIIAYRRD